MVTHRRLRSEPYFEVEREGERGCELVLLREGEVADVVQDVIKGDGHHVVGVGDADVVETVGFIENDLGGQFPDRRRDGQDGDSGQTAHCQLTRKDHCWADFIQSDHPDLAALVGSWLIARVNRQSGHVLSRR